MSNGLITYNPKGSLDDDTWFYKLFSTSLLEANNRESYNILHNLAICPKRISKHDALRSPDGLANWPYKIRIDLWYTHIRKAELLLHNIEGFDLFICEALTLDALNNKINYVYRFQTEVEETMFELY